MADNVLVTPGVGDTIGADEVTDGTLGSVKIGYVKIMDGTLGGTDKAAVGPGGLAVDLGSNNDVTVTSGTITTVGAVTAITNALPAGNNNIGDVDIASIAAGNNNIGDVDVASVVPGTGATNLGKAIDTATGATDTGVLALVTRDDALTTLTPADGDNVQMRTDSVGATWVRATSIDSTVSVQGNVANDSGDSGNPVKVGMKAVDLGATPTAVTSDDRVNWNANRAGIPFVLGGHPNLQTQNIQITDADGAQTDTAIVTVSAGTAIVVTMIDVMASNANTVNVSTRVGFGTANTPAADALQMLLFHPGVPPGGGAVKGNGAGIIGIGASNEDVRLTCDDPVSGSISIIVTYFTIAIG